MENTLTYHFNYDARYIAKIMANPIANSLSVIVERVLAPLKPNRYFPFFDHQQYAGFCALMDFMFRKLIDTPIYDAQRNIGYSNIVYAFNLVFEMMVRYFARSDFLKFLDIELSKLECNPTIYVMAEYMHTPSAARVDKIRQFTLLLENIDFIIETLCGNFALPDKDSILDQFKTETHRYQPYLERVKRDTPAPDIMRETAEKLENDIKLFTQSIEIVESSADGQEAITELRKIDAWKPYENTSVMKGAVQKIGQLVRDRKYGKITPSAFDRQVTEAIELALEQARMLGLRDNRGILSSKSLTLEGQIGFLDQQVAKTVANVLIELMKYLALLIIME